MAEPRDVPPLQGDEAQLFARYELRLRRLTALEVNTQPVIIEDACSFAWAQFIAHQPRRPSALAWLRTVARREAVRLDHLARRVESLEVRLDAPAGPEEIPREHEAVARRHTVETTQRLLEVQDRLAELPVREREVVFLRATGWRYDELAERLGVSFSRVGKLLARADVRLRELDTREMRPATARAERLRQLEDDPPHYIASSIGRPPPLNPKKGGAEWRLEWRRLALAIEDYRTAHAVRDPLRPLGRDAASDPTAQRILDRIGRYREGRSRSQGLER